ncbi:MAG: SUMF1/EgtB/PvdO family nonheme iron enzyme, partial [Pseudomonadota bacterium]
SLDGGAARARSRPLIEQPVVSLPLLSFVLAELWDERDRERKVIPLEALEELGGVGGMLARHADRVLAVLASDEQKEARRLLLALVTTEGTRARRSRAELVFEEGSPADRRRAERVLEALIEGRLVVAGESLEIAHEALVREWPRLQRWLQDASEGRQLAARVEAAAKKWGHLGRGADGLFGDRRLEEVAGQGEKIGELSALAREFLAKSREVAKLARRRRWQLGLGAPLLVVAGLLLAQGAVRLVEWQQRRAYVAARLAEVGPFLAAARALEEQAQARRAAAFRCYGQNDFSGGEAEWGAAVVASEEARLKYAEANAAVDRALAADEHRVESRQLGAQLVYEWLLASERGNDREVAEGLAQRLATLDDRGELLARINAPARLVLEVTPAEATVVLHRVVVGPRSALEVGQPLARDRESSAFTATLAPGSYLLVLTAAGRKTVRYPVQLRRGEEERASLVMPDAGTAPPGFQYVAAGWSLLGAADAEPSRRALAAPAEHRVWVGAFWIAEHEVTFGDYLAFLANLPSEEKERRRPPVIGYDADGVAVLALYRQKVKAGDQLCREKRQQRRCQDWRRFPVVMVSWEDAAAYAAWLDRSGTVKSARLCTEREWERAARGADGRLFPAGNEISPDLANYDATYGFDIEQMGLDEVGSYLAGPSPFGLLDMAGNAFEWVADSIDSDRPNEPLARGGSWFNAVVDARSAARAVVAGGARSGHFGARVCVSPAEDEL